MNSSLLFDFTVNKESKTIHVRRAFDAGRSLVWQAFTTAELLDQWWAPLPYRNQTKTLDFREGGLWLYAMISPENSRHWCRFDYEKIEAAVSYSGYDAFCDEKGVITTDFSRMHWKTEFAEAGDSTTVTITISADTLESLEKIMQMGFKEGFTSGLNQLEQLLASIKKQ